MKKLTRLFLPAFLLFASCATSSRPDQYGQTRNPATQDQPKAGIEEALVTKAVTYLWDELSAPRDSIGQRFPYSGFWSPRGPVSTNSGFYVDEKILATVCQQTGRDLQRIEMFKRRVEMLDNATAKSNQYLNKLVDIWNDNTYNKAVGTILEFCRETNPPGHQVGNMNHLNRAYKDLAKLVSESGLALKGYKFH